MVSDGDARGEAPSAEPGNGPRLTRRGLLQRAGWMFAAAAAFPRGTAWAAPPISPVMAELSNYMSEARGRKLPDEVVEASKQHVLDTFAAMVSGSQLPPGREAIGFARGYGGEKVASIAGSNILCGPIEAALTNGMLAHSDETDDTHAASFSHPGCSIVPAALALGEKCGVAGPHFLRAVALGYDVGTRVTMTLGGRALQNEGHKSSHTMAGTFGSVAAAACGAGLDARQMRWVLDYAAQQSSGIAAWQRDTEHIEKAFVFAGMPARSGATAAVLVQSGWTGVDDILSGADNFLLANAPQADPAGLVEKLGVRYEVIRTSFKKWTVGSPIQAPLDALEILLKKHPFEAEQVSEVIVRVATREAGITNNREMPDICMQHMVAVMVMDKTVSFRAAHDIPRMQDAAVLRMRAKVRLVPDEELDKRLPQREAIVEVTLTDGTRWSEHIQAVRGTPENPMTREEVAAKCDDLMTPVLGQTTTKNLIEKVFSLENVKDIRELRPLLQLA